MKHFFGVALYAEELRTTFSANCNQNLRFGRNVFEKSIEISKIGRKIENLSFARVITFFCEKIVVLSIEAKIPDLGG